MATHGPAERRYPTKSMTTTDGHYIAFNTCTCETWKNTNDEIFDDNLKNVSIFDECLKSFISGSVKLGDECYILCGGLLEPHNGILGSVLAHEPFLDKTTACQAEQGLSAPCLKPWEQSCLLKSSKEQNPFKDKVLDHTRLLKTHQQQTVLHLLQFPMLWLPGLTWYTFDQHKLYSLNIPIWAYLTTVWHIKTMFHALNSKRSLINALAFIKLRPPSHIAWWRAWVVKEP